MKRIAIIFAFVLLLSFAGCSAEKNKLSDITTDLKENTELSVFTEKSEYPADIKIISYTVTNTGDSENSFSADYFELHKKDNGQWKLVNYKEEYSFNLLAQVLASDEETAKELNLEEYFYLPLEKGEYRIIVDDVASNTFQIK